MARLVIKDNITSGGALASGQTLQLGGFIMTARPAVKPAMTSRVIENRLCVDSEYSKWMDPTELSSLNELLDRITALGVATDYDRIGLKPDQREIKSPPITHQIAVVEEQNNNSSPVLRTNYVRISELEEPDTRLRNGTPYPPNLESDDGPEKSVDIPEPELLSSEVSQTPDPKLGQGSDLKPPTHPDIRDLMYVRQQSQETVHHFWARFLLVKDKIEDCRDKDAISAFCNNCTDEGILNAINLRNVSHFADLATIVQKYCAMESA
jgi:hypothetical protein